MTPQTQRRPLSPLKTEQLPYLPQLSTALPPAVQPIQLTDAEAAFIAGNYNGLFQCDATALAQWDVILAKIYPNELNKSLLSGITRSKQPKPKVEQLPSFLDTVRHNRQNGIFMKPPPSPTPTTPNQPKECAKCVSEKCEGHIKSPALVLRFLDNWIRNEKHQPSPSQILREERESQMLFEDLGLKRSPLRVGNLPGVLYPGQEFGVEGATDNESTDDEASVHQQATCCPSASVPLFLFSPTTQTRARARAQEEQNEEQSEAEEISLDEEVKNLQDIEDEDIKEIICGAEISPNDVAVYSSTGKIGMKPRLPYLEHVQHTKQKYETRELFARFDTHVCCITLQLAQKHSFARYKHLSVGLLHFPSEPCPVCGKDPSDTSITEGPVESCTSPSGFKLRVGSTTDCQSSELNQNQSWKEN